MQEGQFNLFSPGDSMEEINPKDAYPLIFDVHYAGRKPSISKAFGLYRDGSLEGICTFGIPPSWSMLEGVCGKEYKKDVFELNRLCFHNNRKNDASKLIGYSLRHLGNKIVVSYADTGAGHTGYVYQATNAIYTGLSSKFKEIYLKSKPHLHHTSHKGKTFAQMEAEHGDDVAYRERSRKHRYVFFCGDKRFKKKARSDLKWPVKDYPK
jgi:hypothetical protein